MTALTKTEGLYDTISVSSEDHLKSAVYFHISGTVQKLNYNNINIRIRSNKKEFYYV